MFVLSTDLPSSPPSILGMQQRLPYSYLLNEWKRLGIHLSQEVCYLGLMPMIRWKYAVIVLSPNHLTFTRWKGRWGSLGGESQNPPQSLCRWNSSLGGLTSRGISQKHTWVYWPGIKMTRVTKRILQPVCLPASVSSLKNIWKLSQGRGNKISNFSGYYSTS